MVCSFRIFRESAVAVPVPSVRLFENSRKLKKKKEKEKSKRAEKITADFADGRSSDEGRGRRARPSYVERLTRIARGGTHGRNLF